MPHALPTDPSELTPIDRWIGECRRILRAHLKREPSVRELSQYVKRDVATVHRHLKRLAACGVLRKDARGRFREPS